MGLAALNMGCSCQDECSDLIDYFLDSLVFLRKERYLKTLLNPDTFVETLELELGEEYDVETLNCLTYDIFSKSVLKKIIVIAMNKQYYLMKIKRILKKIYSIQMI